MKYFLDVIKIFLLACIAFFLYQNGKDAPVDGKAIESVEVETANSKKETELRTIMEYPIRQVFKFPDDVKFSYVVFEEKGVYSDIGIKLSNPHDDIVTAKMCGFYSAKNGMGAYGAPRKFYAMMAIDNQSKDIGGEFWLVNDEGEVKRTLSLTSSYLLSDNKGDFDKKWSELCGDDKRKFLGQYENYKTEMALFHAQYIEESLRSRLESNKDMLGMLNACLSTGELQPCIFSASCMTDSEFSKENKSCDIVTAICNDANQSCTKENIDNHVTESEEK
ncbi:hypothetical protein [Endozoicomonas elysicola]|uniref:Uncharacterized protein n=1 Tax=Endozoicomonas elysicola TaxID=305900 RepID=A0A081KAV5_9GAMM|nr:hypothetical protein [Endozoicomonas elysicola]KEI71281.1 hypothetical protein GV64_11495 [Endozoicomonas elysicola]